MAEPKSAQCNVDHVHSTLPKEVWPQERGPGNLWRSTMCPKKSFGKLTGFAGALTTERLQRTRLWNVWRLEPSRSTPPSRSHSSVASNLICHESSKQTDRKSHPGQQQKAILTTKTPEKHNSSNKTKKFKICQSNRHRNTEMKT